VRTWLTLVALSALAGGVCGLAVRPARAVAVGAAVPWVGCFAWVIHTSSSRPAATWGPLWLAAQFIGGTVAAAVGALAAAAAVARRG
jgi:hypothetical protein